MEKKIHIEYNQDDKDALAEFAEYQLKTYGTVVKYDEIPPSGNTVTATITTTGNCTTDSEQT